MSAPFGGTVGSTPCSIPKSPMHFRPRTNVWPASPNVTRSAASPRSLSDVISSNGPSGSPSISRNRRISDPCPPCPPGSPGISRNRRMSVPSLSLHAIVNNAGSCAPSVPGGPLSPRALSYIAPQFCSSRFQQRSVSPSQFQQRSASPLSNHANVPVNTQPPSHRMESTKTYTKGMNGYPLRPEAAAPFTSRPPQQVESSKSKPKLPKALKIGNATMLKTLGRDLTKLGETGALDPLVGRKSEIEQMIQALARRRKNNPVLVGDPGVGKTAVVEGLAQQIAKGDVPEALREKTIMELDVASLLAGTKNRGEFEARMKKVIDEVLDSSGQIILFIDEIHTIVGAGLSGSSNGSSLDAASILKPVLARGDIQCIGATTISEYRAHIEKDSSLERRFQPITVNETSIPETVQILKGLAERYEYHHKVQYSDEALIACVKLAAEHISERFMPDKSIDVFDEVGALVRLRHQKNSLAESGLPQLARQQLQALQAEKHAAVKSERYADAARLKIQETNMQIKIQRLSSKVQEDKDNSISIPCPIVTAEDVALIVSRKTGVPLEKLSDDDSAQLLNLEIALHRRMVGQSRAVNAVSKALRRARAGLKNPNRPIASFLFCGPTGVGKTELCKALSEVYFGKEDAMIRLDMSEFVEMHSVAKLIGSPAGYIGYGDENQLTDRVRRKPYSLVLFDEVEKAHPDVLNLMLQMMEDGRLSDSSGRSVTFRNTLIVLTSNVCRQNCELNKTFSPEFLNRLDEIIPFSPLSRQETASIAELELAKTIRRVKDKGVTLTLSQAFKDEVVKQGFDAVYGARPLRRTVVRLLDDELANCFLRQPFTNSGIIHVDVEGDHRVVVAYSAEESENSECSAELPEESCSSDGENRQMISQIASVLPLRTVPKSSDADTDSTKGSESSPRLNIGECPH